MKPGNDVRSNSVELRASPGAGRLHRQQVAGMAFHVSFVSAAGERPEELETARPAPDVVVSMAGDGGRSRAPQGLGRQGEALRRGPGRGEGHRRHRQAPLGGPSTGGHPCAASPRNFKTR